MEEWEEGRGSKTLDLLLACLWMPGMVSLAFMRPVVFSYIWSWGVPLFVITLSLIWIKSRKRA